MTPPITEVMTEDPITLGVDEGLDVAHSLMVCCRIRHLPVVRGGQLCGMISARDLAGVPPGATASQVMRAPVQTLTPEDSVAVAAERLLTHGFSSLPVLRHGQVVGIVTCTDLVRFACERLGEEPVARLMTSIPLITVEPDRPITLARMEMQSAHIRHLPVIEGQELVGFVSDLDLLAAPSEGTIRDAMGQHVPSVAASARATFAGRRLVRDRLDALPVVQAGRLAGVISAFDFLHRVV